MADQRRRLMRLRDNVYSFVREHPVLGPVEEELYWMKCDGCGRTQELDDRLVFLDLPDQLEGWSRTSDGKDFCPSCSS
jgi:hypothetical protein